MTSYLGKSVSAWDNELKTANPDINTLISLEEELEKSRVQMQQLSNLFCFVKLRSQQKQKI